MGEFCGMVKCLEPVSIQLDFSGFLDSRLLVNLCLLESLESEQLCFVHVSTVQLFRET